MAYTIRIRQLRAYNASMQTGSMTRAAELLNLSRPTNQDRFTLMQAPFIVRYPRRISGGHVPVSLIDVANDTAPTILELCGIPIPDDVQGVSYLSLLDGGDVPVRDAVLYEHMLQMKFLVSGPGGDTSRTYTLPGAPSGPTG